LLFFAIDYFQMKMWGENRFFFFLEIGQGEPQYR